MRFNRLAVLSVIVALLAAGCESANIPAETADYAVDPNKCTCPKVIAGVRQTIDRLEKAGAFGEHQLRPVENAGAFFLLQPRVSPAAVTAEVGMVWEDKSGVRRKAKVESSDMKIVFQDGFDQPTARWKWDVSKIWADNVAKIDADSISGLIPKYVVSTTVRAPKNPAYWSVAPVMF